MIYGVEHPTSLGYESLPAMFCPSVDRPVAHRLIVCRDLQIAGTPSARVT